MKVDSSLRRDGRFVHRADLGPGFGLGLTRRGIGFPPDHQRRHRAAAGDFIARACPDTLRSTSGGDAA
jgi:hypothetical protein